MLAVPGSHEAEPIAYAQMPLSIFRRSEEMTALRYDRLISRETDQMTLARGKIGGYEFNRMVVLFSMMDGAREIPCAVSASAMDEIENVPRTAPDQREQQFLRLRDRIEQCASRKFLAGEFEGKPAGIILRGIDFRRS